jgi:hypothetical protein
MVVNDGVSTEEVKLEAEICGFHNSEENIFRIIKSRRLRWAGHVARMGERRGAYRVLVWQFEGRRPLGRPERR